MLATKLLSRLSRPAVRGVAGTQRFEHTLPALPYGYNALEPVISQEIMELHHLKHHATYVTNLNIAEKQLKDSLEKEDVSGVIAVQNAMRFNGGGHINHSIFWQNLSPNGGGEPTGGLLLAIKINFGTVDAFRKLMTAKTVAIQGSGWGWLGYNPQFKRLEVATCGNQDPLQATTGLVPLFGIDVWEHAYYLQYKNVRPEYVKAIWNIANWEDIGHRYTAASK